MGVMCEINLKDNTIGVYKPGQQVSGTIKYAVDKPIEIKTIIISLLGKGQCSWKEESFGKETHYHGSEEYVSQHINILNKESDEHFTLEPNLYEAPFQFTLPTNIPPSFKGYYGSINYLIQIKFDKRALLSRKKVYKKHLVVEGNVNTSELDISQLNTPTIYGLQKKLSRLFSNADNAINLKVEINNSLLVSGSNVSLNFVVTNDTKVKVKIQSEIQEHVTYKASCGRTTFSQKIIKDSTVSSDVIPRNSSSKFSLVVPVDSELYTFQTEQIIQRKYNVRVTAKVPMPHINEILDIPVVIGRIADNNNKNSDVKLPDEPPSYWEVMAEEKY